VRTRLTLYALAYHGATGILHSIDYPQVWHVRVAAERYLRTVPEVRRPNYKIVKLVQIVERLPRPKKGRSKS
jgi:hypothetical protein